MQPVIHVPYASTMIPDRYRSPFVLSDDELTAEAALSAELWTDMLARACWPAATIIESPIARIVCDVECCDDHAGKFLAARGRGLFHTVKHDGQPLRRVLSGIEQEDLKAAIYAPHWLQLRRAAAGHVLIDLQSFPARPWPVDIKTEIPRPEIDIGAGAGLTPSRWLEALVHYFEQMGYDVGVNSTDGGVIDVGSIATVIIKVRQDLIANGPDSTRWEPLVDTLNLMPTSLWIGHSKVRPRLSPVSRSIQT
jgi:N-formylglutamate deformylase